MRTGFHDPAGRKKAVAVGALKYSGCQAAFVTIGGDALGRVFVLEALAGKWSPMEMQQQLFEQCDRWNPFAYGVESSAMQSLYAELTIHQARTEGRLVKIVSVDQPTTVSKDFRIRQALRPLASRGQLFIAAKHVELRHEMASFPSAARKDIIDALASAVMLLPPALPKAAVADERAERLAWLRETGASPQYLSEVARGLHD